MMLGAELPESKVDELNAALEVIDNLTRDLESKKVTVKKSQSKSDAIEIIIRQAIAIALHWEQMPEEDKLVPKIVGSSEEVQIGTDHTRWSVEKMAAEINKLNAVAGHHKIAKQQLYKETGRLIEEIYVKLKAEGQLEVPADVDPGKPRKPIADIRQQMEDDPEYVVPVDDDGQVVLKPNYNPVLDLFYDKMKELGIKLSRRTALKRASWYNLCSVFPAFVQVHGAYSVFVEGNVKATYRKIAKLTKEERDTLRTSEPATVYRFGDVVVQPVTARPMEAIGFKLADDKWLAPSVPGYGSSYTDDTLPSAAHGPAEEGWSMHHSFNALVGDARSIESIHQRPLQLTVDEQLREAIADHDAHEEFMSGEASSPEGEGDSTEPSSDSESMSSSDQSDQSGGMETDGQAIEPAGAGPAGAGRSGSDEMEVAAAASVEKSMSDLAVEEDVLERIGTLPAEEIVATICVKFGYGEDSASTSSHLIQLPTIDVTAEEFIRMSRFSFSNNLGILWAIVSSAVKTGGLPSMSSDAIKNVKLVQFIQTNIDYQARWQLVQLKEDRRCKNNLRKINKAWNDPIPGVGANWEVYYKGGGNADPVLEWVKDHWDVDRQRLRVLPLRKQQMVDALSKDEVDLSEIEAAVESMLSDLPGTIRAGASRTWAKPKPVRTGAPRNTTSKPQTKAGPNTKYRTDAVVSVQSKKRTGIKGDPSPSAPPTDLAEVMKAVLETQAYAKAVLSALKATQPTSKPPNPTHVKPPFVKPPSERAFVKPPNPDVVDATATTTLAPL